MKNEAGIFVEILIRT